MIVTVPLLDHFAYYSACVNRISALQRTMTDRWAEVDMFPRASRSTFLSTSTTDSENPGTVVMHWTRIPDAMEQIGRTAKWNLGLHETEALMVLR